MTLVSLLLTAPLWADVAPGGCRCDAASFAPNLFAIAIAAGLTLYRK